MSFFWNVGFELVHVQVLPVWHLLLDGEAVHEPCELGMQATEMVWGLVDQEGWLDRNLLSCMATLVIMSRNQLWLQGQPSLKREIIVFQGQHELKGDLQSIPILCSSPGCLCGSNSLNFDSDNGEERPVWINWDRSILSHLWGSAG